MNYLLFAHAHIGGAGFALVLVAAVLIIGLFFLGKEFQK
jgi:hypothetical protein